MSEIVSANTLFHFTPSRESLLSILSGGFYVKYSLEIFDNLVDDKNAEIVIPMTCFCDIPLSQIKNHTTNYGNYAIGLTKDWGIRNSISPVHYCYPNSSTSEILKLTIKNLDNFFEIKDNTVEEKQEEIKLKNTLPKPLYDILLSEQVSDYLTLGKKIVDIQNLISHLVRFLKPYQGKIFRSDTYSKDSVKFYDEREWRYVPPRELLQELNVKDSYKGEFFKDLRKRRYINMKLASKMKLKFEPSDVRFIVVKKDSEIPIFIERLYSVFDKNATSYDLRLLGSRIISLEQIIENI